MSNAVRHSFHTATDPHGVANFASGRGNADVRSTEPESQPTPILIARADAIRAFDLFQPEPGEFATTSPGVAAPTAAAVVPIADGQFAREVARALDTPQPAPAPLNLPLGGVAPTDREIASARALMIGWIAAFAIAAFAFLAQGPTVTTRPGEAAPPPAPKVEAGTSQPGDIKLNPEVAAKPATPRAKRVNREATPAAPASSAPSSKP
jgi:hypothetical protein